MLVLTAWLPGGLLIRLLSWVNLLLTISVCIPYTRVCFPNDAKLILLLRRKDADGKRIAAILNLLFLDAQGKLPREWPAALVAELDVTANDKSRLPVAIGLLLSDAAEKKDSERAAELLERALAICDQMLPDARRDFLIAASCYHGFHRRDASRSEEWLKRARSVKSGASQKDWDSRALAGVSYAKGDYTQSAEFLASYVALLDRQPMSGMVVAERERMIALRNTLTAHAYAQACEGELTLLTIPGAT